MHSTGMAITAACLIVTLTTAGCAERGSDAGEMTPHAALVDTSFALFESDSLYAAWPAVVRADDGSILVLYTETDEHMGPDGRIVGIRSEDEGRTWSDPFEIYDTPLDERESGLTALRDGRLIAHIWSTRHTADSYGGMAPGSYFDHVVDAWVETVESDAYRGAAAHEGGRVIVSDDGGRTWSDPVDGPDTIHGGIELAGGGILVASYRLKRDYVTVHRADSPEGPYVQIAEVGASAGRPDSLRLGEPSILQLPAGRVIMMMRATPKPYSDSDPRSFIWETYSDDGGETWAAPFPTPLWGFPPHLMLHGDGRAVAVYGHRRPPFGQRAAVSENGISWRIENEIILRDDAPNKDLGYPASVELNDGRVLTVYYQSHSSDTLRPTEGPPPDRHKPDIWATIWRMPGS